MGSLSLSLSLSLNFVGVLFSIVKLQIKPAYN